MTSCFQGRFGLTSRLALPRSADIWMNCEQLWVTVVSRCIRHGSGTGAPSAGSGREALVATLPDTDHSW